MSIRARLKRLEVLTAPPPEPRDPEPLMEAAGINVSGLGARLDEMLAAQPGTELTDLTAIYPWVSTVATWVRRLVAAADRGEEVDLREAPRWLFEAGYPTGTKYCHHCGRPRSGKEPCRACAASGRTARGPK